MRTVPGTFGPNAAPTKIEMITCQYLLRCLPCHSRPARRAPEAPVTNHLCIKQLTARRDFHPPIAGHSDASDPLNIYKSLTTLPYTLPFLFVRRLLGPRSRKTVATFSKPVSAGE